MEWVGAVDVIQRIARHVVFKIARLPPSSEVKPHGEFPEGDEWALFYLDGLEVVRRVQAGLRHEGQQENSIPQDVLWRRFVDACAELRLPLVAGKRVVRQCRKKGHRTLRREFALLAMPWWSVGGLQHVVGSFRYACGFRRPLFLLHLCRRLRGDHRAPGPRYFQAHCSWRLGGDVGGASEASVVTQSCNVATQVFRGGSCSPVERRSIKSAR